MQLHLVESLRLADVFNELAFQNFNLVFVWAIPYVVNSDVLHESAVKDHHELVVVMDCQLIVVLPYLLKVLDHVHCKVFVHNLTLNHFIFNFMKNVVGLKFQFHFVRNFLLFFRTTLAVA